MAAPASAAPIACSAIWSGVIGSASDMVGVWIAPVTAQVMTTLSEFAAIVLSRFADDPSCAGLTRASISFAKSLNEAGWIATEVALARLPQVLKRRKSGRPDLPCQARQ